MISVASFLSQDCGVERVGPFGWRVGFQYLPDISDRVKFAWKIQRDMAERGWALEDIKKDIEKRKPGCSCQSGHRGCMLVCSSQVGVQFTGWFCSSQVGLPFTAKSRKSREQSAGWQLAA